MLHYLRFQNANEAMVHEVVLVTNIQCDYALAFQVRREFANKILVVSLFHCEDELGPFKNFWRYGFVCAVRGSSRSRIASRPIRKHLLGVRAAQAVQAAYE